MARFVTHLRGEFADLRMIVFRFGIAVMAGMLGVIATLVGTIVTGSIGG
jgi:hypothetical protein